MKSSSLHSSGQILEVEVGSVAYIQYLNIDGADLPLPTSYDVELTDVEADSSGETEAGTTQRDIVRSGVVKIQVAFQVSPYWLKQLSIFRKEPVLSVRYFDTETLDFKTTKMYINEFKSSLEKDTSYKGLWKVSFNLNEY